MASILSVSIISCDSESNSDYRKCITIDIFGKNGKKYFGYNDRSSVELISILSDGTTVPYEQDYSRLTVTVAPAQLEYVGDFNFDARRISEGDRTSDRVLVKYNSKEQDEFRFTVDNNYNIDKVYFNDAIVYSKNGGGSMNIKVWRQK